MKISNEAKIGGMVVIVIVILTGLTVRTGKIKFSETGYNIKVRFADIDGVNLNSPVMYNGFEVGMVDDIRIVDTPEDVKLELRLWIKGKARLREGAKVYVKNLGFMGEKYVGITSGGVNRKYLSEGAVLEGESPPDLGVLYQEAQDVLVHIKGITGNLNERLETNKDVVDDIFTNANDTMKNLSSISANTNNRLETNEAKIDMIITNLEALSVNFKELSQDLKLHPWKLLYRSKEDSR